MSVTEKKSFSIKDFRPKRFRVRGAVFKLWGPVTTSFEVCVCVCVCGGGGGG